MSCSPFDLKDYLLQELAAGERLRTEAHIQTCQACREELDRLSLTQAMLGSLRDEEIPQRIAFVSDKIFEPSPWRRALAAFWGSGARLAFAAAAMLSAAILYSALTRPAPVVAHNSAPAAVSAADLQQRIETAVTKAVAESEARQSARTQQAVAEIERHQQIVEAELEFSQRRAAINRVASAGYGVPIRPNGDAK